MCVCVCVCERERERDRERERERESSSNTSYYNKTLALVKFESSKALRLNDKFLDILK